MILFAGCGITQDIKQINTEALTEFGADLAEELSKELGDEELSEEEAKIFQKISKLDDSDVSSDTVKVENIATAIKKMAHMPPSAISKMKLHGNIGLVMSIFYALAGLLFILTRKHALKIVTTALVVSLLFVIYQVIDTRNLEVSPIMKMGLNFNLYMGAILDVILLIIIFFSDKSFFTNNQSGKDFYDEVPTA